MKPVLLAVTLFLVPVPALAGDVTLGEVQASSSYVFERQAARVSKNPVANVSINWQQSTDVSGYAWVQLGDRYGRELDLGETFSHDFGHVNVHGEAAVYLYMDGFKPVYTAGLGASVPAGPVFLDVDIQRYTGGFDSTLKSIAVRIPSTSGVEISFGKAWNKPEHLNPWFGRVSLPVGRGKHAPTVGLRGFMGAGHGAVVDVTAHF